MGDLAPTIEDLLGAVSLVGIQTVRLIVERVDNPPHVESIEITPQHELNIQISDDDDGFRVLLDTFIDAHVGHVQCDLSVEYKLQGLLASSISAPVMQEFVNNVAVMTLIPFLRQAVADLTQRVFVNPLIMPIFRLGEISFELTREG